MRSILFLVIWLGSLGSAVCQTNSSSRTNGLWFPVGEKLSYGLYWGIIPVGTAEFWSEWGEHEGEEVVILRATAKTGHIVAKLYPVKDNIEVIVDPDDFKPVRYTQKLHEGGKKRHDTIEFDYENEEAHWVSGIDEKKEYTLEIDKDTRDVLSLVYYMRKKGMDPSEKRKFRVAVDEKVYDLTAEAEGREEIRVAKYGQVKCLKVQPTAKFGEIFVRKGRVRLWFSDDSTRLCVKMAAKVPLASVKALLLDVEGPGNDIWEQRAESD